jgi:hypothetical protein
LAARLKRFPLVPADNAGLRPFRDAWAAGRASLRVVAGRAAELFLAPGAAWLPLRDFQLGFAALGVRFAVPLRSVPFAFAVLEGEWPFPACEPFFDACPLQ